MAVLWPRYAASKQRVIAGSKTAGRFVTILILVVFVLSFVAVVMWLRKKMSPDPKPTLHTQIISPVCGRPPALSQGIR